MAKKKFFLDKKSKQIRTKSLDELKKNEIEIRDDESLTGGALERPGWLEVPANDPATGSNESHSSSIL